MSLAEFVVNFTDSVTGSQVAGGLAALAAVSFVRWYIRNLKFSSIPTVGYSEPTLSWISAIQFITNAREMVHEGYTKYKPGVFKVANIDGWAVVATGAQYIDEVRKAPDEVLSFVEATEQRQQIKYTLGPGVGTGYHVSVAKTQLTRNLVVLFDDISDETVAAFHDLIPVKDDGQWVKVRTQNMLQNVICRVSNRLFIGLPLCRNAEWIKLNINFTIDAVIGAQILRLFPEFLKPIAGRLFTNVPASHKRGFALMKPLIEERMHLMATYGDKWEDRPNDFLQWLMDHEEGQKQNPQDYCRRLMSTNFAAIHTSSLNMTQALYHLAGHPEWQKELRDEVEEVVRAEGWSKAAMGKMRKIDSFFREQQRYAGLGVLAMSRYALQPFTFSNGVHVPKGTFIACAQYDTHHDEENYANPDVFDPIRFASMREGEGEGTKHQMVATSTEFINFGHGRHACPGRFFAANELKCLLAHIVIDYDVAFEDESVGYPPNKCINGNFVPADIDIMFRKRHV
ncbi:cytochrome P450 [Peniophora sp. CONT]|nr:cytochrome P450 [Peniophora sp. CONT]